MTRMTVRALIAAALGASVGAIALIVVFRSHPNLIFEMDRDLPGRISSGFYPAEVVGDETFAWTSERAQFNVLSVNRRTEWRCVVRVNGGRPAGVPQPTVTVSIDGETDSPGLTATNSYQDIGITAPARPKAGMRIIITSSLTFQPSADPRQLGVRVDRVACTPAGAVWPPGRAIVAAMTSAAILGLAFVLIGMSVLAHRLTVAAVAIIQAFPLSMGVGLYTAYVGTVMSLAVWIALVAILGAVIVRWRTRRTGGGPSFAIGFTTAVLFVKLLALLHPSKAIVDALFHAHRLDDVLRGQYFFTQVMPGGVRFPYAIALYVFASPWAGLTRDHIALLRIVVSASEAAAGVLLYWAIVRAWRNATAAAIALILYHVLPISFVVVGNANLTNAFGQSAAVAAMSTLIGWPLGLRRILQIVGLAILTALAFLSHVSTLLTLAVTIVVAAALSLWRGGRQEWSATVSILAALILASVISVVLYYGRPEFYAAYRSIRSTQAERTDTAGAAAQTPSGNRLSEGAIPIKSLPSRIGSAAGFVGSGIGWPIVALGLIGLWRVFSESGSGRLTWAIFAWLLAGAAFVLFGIVAPGGVGHQRQAEEFISRAVYSMSPGVLVLAGSGAAWGLRAWFFLRAAVAALIGLAAFLAGLQWISWIR